ncbi:MAG: tetratricopeptide repeat protein [Chthoniobacterales bacterium]
MRALIAIFACFAAIVSFAAEQKIGGADLLVEATSEARAGHLDAALASVAAAEKSGASESNVLALRGLIHLEQEKLDEAVAEFRAAHEKDPKVAGPRFHLGDALLRQKKWEDARAIYGAMEKETNVLILNERLRYAILLTFLGAKDDAGAKAALDRLVFPTESPAYYYAQAAWAFAHDSKSAAEKWLKTADKMFEQKKQTAWFARPLYDFGWIKDKPPIPLD